MSGWGESGWDWRGGESGELGMRRHPTGEVYLYDEGEHWRDEVTRDQLCKLYDLLRAEFAAEVSPDGYVVVLFGGAADGWCSLAMCPLGTVSWFADETDAKAYAGTLPEGFQPHVLSVHRPEP